MKKLSLHLISYTFERSETDVRRLFKVFEVHSELIPEKVGWKEPVKTPYSKQALIEEYRKSMSTLLWKNFYLSGLLFFPSLKSKRSWMILTSKTKEKDLTMFVRDLAYVFDCDFGCIAPDSYQTFNPNATLDCQSDELINSSTLVFFKSNVFFSSNKDFSEKLRSLFPNFSEVDGYKFYSKL